MRKLRIFRIRRFTKNEEGGALAELAILIPFLILMIAAVTELGRLFQNFNTLSKSTRAAARYLTTVTYTPEHIAAARNVALCGKTNCDGVEPVVSGLTIDEVKDGREGDAANPITVTIYIDGYTFSPLFNLGAMLGDNKFMSLPLKPSTTMYYYQVDAAGGTE
jgi:Flp pilus assembly pilin Flp